MNPSRNIKYFPNVYSFDKMKLVLTNFYFMFTFWYYPVSFPINLVHFIALKRLMLQVNFVAFNNNKQTKTTQKPKPTSQTKNPNNSKAKQKLTNQQTTNKKIFWIIIGFFQGTWMYWQHYFIGVWLQKSW